MAEQAVVSERGGWVYLDPENAREHPDYGVFGWALFLLAVLFVGPMVLLWQDVEIVFGPYDQPSNAWIMLVVDFVLLLACWGACRQLGAERPQFYAWYLIAVILGLCSLAVFISLCLFDVREILPFGVRVESEGGWRGLLAEVPSIVWWGIVLRVLGLLLASVYVMQSRRLHVTLSKRVSTHDPYLSQAWRAAASPARPQPAGQGSLYPDAPQPATPAAEATTTVTETRTVTRTETRVEPRVDAPPPRAPEPPPVARPAQPAPAAAPAVTATPATPTSAGPAAPMPAMPDDRRLRARLKQLDDARAAGLISDAEYEARRSSLLNG